MLLTTHLCLCFWRFSSLQIKTNLNGPYPLFKMKCDFVYHQLYYYGLLRENGCLLPSLLVENEPLSLTRRKILATCLYELQPSRMPEHHFNTRRPIT